MHSSTGTPPVTGDHQRVSCPVDAPGAGRINGEGSAARGSAPATEAFQEQDMSEPEICRCRPRTPPLALISARVNAIHADPVVRAAPVKAIGGTY